MLALRQLEAAPDYGAAATRMAVFLSVRLAGGRRPECFDAIRASDGDGPHLVAIPDLKRFRIFGPIGVDGLALLQGPGCQLM